MRSSARVLFCIFSGEGANITVLVSQGFCFVLFLVVVV